MEDFYPSEVARLVLGYLKEVKCLDTWQMFMKESADLQEHYRLYQEGRVYSTNVDGKSLLDVLQEYRSLKREDNRINTLCKEASFPSQSANSSSAKDIGSSADVIKQVTAIIQIFENLFSLFKNNKVSDVMNGQAKDKSENILLRENLATQDKLHSSENLLHSDPSNTVNNITNIADEDTEIQVVSNMQLYSNSVIEPCIPSSMELNQIGTSCAQRNVQPFIKEEEEEDDDEVVILSCQKASEDNPTSMSIAKINGHDNGNESEDTLLDEHVALQEELHSNEEHLLLKPNILKNNVNVNLSHENTEPSIVNGIELHSNSIVDTLKQPNTKVSLRSNSTSPCTQRNIPTVQEEGIKLLSCEKALKEFSASLSSDKAHIDCITNNTNENSSIKKEIFIHPYSVEKENNRNEMFHSSSANTLSDEQIRGNNNLGKNSSLNVFGNNMAINEAHVSKELCYNNSSPTKSEDIAVHSVAGNVNHLLHDKKDSGTEYQNNTANVGNIVLSNIADPQNCANLYTATQCVKFASPHSLQPTSSSVQPVFLRTYSSLPTIIVRNNGYQYVVNNPSLNLSNNRNDTILPIQTFSTTGNVCRSSKAVDQPYENNSGNVMTVGTGGIIQPRKVYLTQGSKIDEIALKLSSFNQAPSVQNSSEIMDTAEKEAVEKHPKKKKKSHRKATAADPPVRRYNRPAKRKSRRIFFSLSSSESEKEEPKSSVKNISNSDSQNNQSPVLASLISSAKLLSERKARIDIAIKNPLNFESLPKHKNGSSGENVQAVQNKRSSDAAMLTDSDVLNYPPPKKPSSLSKSPKKGIPSKSKRAKRKSPKKRNKKPKVENAITETLLYDTAQKVAKHKPVSTEMASSVLKAMEKALQLVKVPENEEFVSPSQINTCKLSGSDKTDKYINENISSMLINGVSHLNEPNELKSQSQIGSLFNFSKSSFEQSVVCKNQIFTQSDQLNQRVDEDMHPPNSNTKSVKNSSSDSPTCSSEQQNNEESNYEANKTIKNLEHYTNCKVVLKCLSLAGNTASIMKKPETFSEKSESSLTETAKSQNKRTNNFVDSSKSTETMKFPESVEKMCFRESSIESNLETNNPASSTINSVHQQQNLNELSLVIKKEQDTDDSPENGIISHSLFESTNENISSYESVKVKVEEFEYTCH